MTCKTCGETKCSCKNKEFTKAVVEINNPEQITLMRKVVIPASMGDDTTVPPVVGKYKNVLLFYEANNKSYLYSSDGIPTLLANGLTDYEEAVNLPQINGVTLTGDKSAADLGLQNTLSVTPGTGIKLENDELSGLPATENTIGMVKPGDGLEVDTNGTLSISEIEQYAHFFDTVADMKSATNLVAGDYARTLGFHSVNDGGGALYKITDTGTADEMGVIAVGSLYANIIVSETVTPEMFGAYGDGTHDDISFFNYAFTRASKVLVSGKTYLLSTQLTIPENKEISGNSETFGYAKLKAANGVKITGRDITFKNIELIGASQSGYGLYCCGNNEGGDTPSANHFARNIIENVIISNYNYGIYINAVTWSNSFRNIRINFCNYGLYNTETYYIMTTTFENVYFSGCIEYDVNLKKTNTQFNNCNFGISSIHPVLFSQSCNILINNSNFECDKYIDGAGTILEITGKNITIDNCTFKMCCSSTMSLFNTGAAVQCFELNNNNYISVNLSSPNALTAIFNSQIAGPKYGCIRINDGNDDFPFNIENANRLPYGKYLYIKWHGLIQTYSDVSDLTKINKGDMVYYHQDNTIKYYNGTSMVTI